MAGLVVFKFLFALLYSVKWNCRQMCSSRYRKSKVNVEKDFKRIKAKNDNCSTDEDEDFNDEVEKSKKTEKLS